MHNGKILIVEDFEDYDNNGKSNLYCLNQKLEIEWFLPFPTKNPSWMDNYVGFTTNGERVFANTFSCFRVEIDIEKGEIINVQFTK